MAGFLRRCRACQDEVRGLRDAATSLAFAVAGEPTLRCARVVAAVSRTRQLPPESRSSSGLQTPAIVLPRLVAAVAVAALVAVAVLTVAQVEAQPELPALAFTDPARPVKAR
jgi:hypothetical protein